MAKIKLNQIPIVSTIALFFIISTVLSLFWQRDNFFYIQRQLAANPNNADNYYQAAAILLKNNQFKKAENLLNLGENHKIASPDLWQQKHLEDPKDVAAMVDLWQQTVAEKPDYRDGYLQLAFLNLKLHNYQEAYLATQKALKVDPYYLPAQEMKTLLDKLERN